MEKIKHKIRWPEKVERGYEVFIADFILSESTSPLPDKVIYGCHNSDTVGSITLPFGWHLLSRIWTIQDIYWEDKYDCPSMRRGATLLDKIAR